MTENTPATTTPQGVTPPQLANAIIRVFAEKKPGNDLSAAYGITVALWEHPRFGPLLRGEGAPAPVRVVLPEEVPAGLCERLWIGLAFMAYRDGCRDAWAAARAEVARQQGGQAGGQAPLEGLVPVCYDAGRGTRIERTRVTPCPLWAVRRGVMRMSINREWTFEPMPSGCTPEYLAMHSFPSPAAAWAELQLYRETAFSDITPGEGGQADG